MFSFRPRPVRKGFTLLELIVVVVVLSILAALAIPSFNAVKNTAAEKTAIASAEAVVRNAKALAAFDGAALSDEYVDAAGLETVGYDPNDNTLVVTSGGETGVAQINATTGAVTIFGGGGPAVLTFTPGVDYPSNFNVYGQGYGSGAGVLDSLSQLTVSATLWNEFGAGASVTIVLTDGANSATYAATVVISAPSLNFSLLRTEPNFWTQFSNFPNTSYQVQSMTWDAVTRTLTLNV